MSLLGKRHKKKYGKVSLRKLSRRPSLGCRQHLSTRELIERTQIDRVKRKARND
jgi:hypothetical protein